MIAATECCGCYTSNELAGNKQCCVSVCSIGQHTSKPQRQYPKSIFHRFATRALAHVCTDVKQTKAATGTLVRTQALLLFESNVLLNVGTVDDASKLS
uniref:Uncharacterized protein n=1 Tax=Ascaris lumbricoides TaxID=6252 RepID=A0A0M3HY39_ASCLU